MLVRDVMQSPVATVPADASLADAVAEMLDTPSRCVVVMTESPSQKLGVLAEADVLFALFEYEGPYAANGRLVATVDALRGIDPDAALDSITVRDAIRRPVVTVGPKLTLSDALLRMREESVRYLVVTEQLERVGIVTPADIGRHLDDILREVRTVNARRPNWNDDQNA